MTDPIINPPADEAEDNSTDPKTPQQVSTPATANHDTKTSSNGLPIFATLLALSALIGSALTWYQTQVKQVQSESSLAVGVTEIGGEVSRLGDSISRLQSQQDDVVTEDQLSNRLIQLNARLNSAMESLADRQSSLNDSINKISNDRQKGVDVYLLEEVSQLLKLANHSAVFANDKSAAMAALGLADGQLKQLGDPRYAGVRRKINEELAQLENAQQADVVALSATLASVAKIIPALPLFNEPPTQAVERAAEEPEQAMSWRSELSKVWRDITGLIRIQRVDQAPVPLLAPEQRYFLNQNLQLHLNKAELAVLRHSDAVFQQSLSSAVDWINQYFDRTDPQVQQVLGQLQELQTQQLHAQLPDITGSYDALQRVKGG